MDGLAEQAAHVELLAVQFNARFRPDGSEQRGAGHEVIEGHGGRIGLQPDDAADQAVFEGDFVGIGTEGCPGGEGLRSQSANQPPRARLTASGKDAASRRMRKPEQDHFHAARLKDSHGEGNA